MMRRRTRRGAGRRNWKTGTASFRSSSSSSLCCPVTRCHPFPHPPHVLLSRPLLVSSTISRFLLRCLRHTAAEGRGEEAAEHQHSHLHTAPLAEHARAAAPSILLHPRQTTCSFSHSNTVLLNRVLSTATNIPLVLTAIAAYSQSLNFWEMNQTRLILLNLNASLPFFVCQHSPTSPNSHPSAVCQNASCCSFSLPPPRLFDVSLRFCAHPHDRRDAAVRRLARRVGGQLCGLEDQSSSSHHHHPAVPSHHVLPLGRRRQRRFPSHHRQPRPPHSTRTSQAHLVASAC
ncbi:hypothetical protein BLNAU_23274 [Blattamonas nauphoetae]|uniref:Uncharacterized protein n=1 Tax=Blattamonas nauphoetae TaxID=2049346 RepID=A0ABQ9WR64_9EUKA|nr:hypothetical protein BLNAU_23274 [Blattamonas nauphoetae]